MTKIIDKRVLADTTSTTPALCAHEGVLVLAWKGSGNDALNISLSLDGGNSFVGKVTFGETSSEGPALVSLDPMPTMLGGGCFIAWKGSGNDNLNLARVLFQRDAGGRIIAVNGIDPVTFSDTSHSAPALAELVTQTADTGRILLCWRGEGGEHINVAKVQLDGL